MGAPPQDQSPLAASWPRDLVPATRFFNDKEKRLDTMSIVCIMYKYRVHTGFILAV